MVIGVFIMFVNSNRSLQKFDFLGQSQDIFHIIVIGPPLVVNISYTNYNTILFKFQSSLESPQTSKTTED